MMKRTLASLVAALVVSSAAAACGTTTGGAQTATGGPSPSAQIATNDPPPSAAPARAPSLPDGSFEETGDWSMGPHTAIVDNAAHEGKRSLRMELNHGLGSDNVTRSAYFLDVEIGPDYVIDFYYRYENCKSAIFTLHVGAYEKRLSLDGSSAEWKKGSMIVSFAKKPVWLDITAGRMGAAEAYAAAEFDNNVFWLDDVTIRRRD